MKAIIPCNHLLFAPTRHYSAICTEALRQDCKRIDVKRAAIEVAHCGNDKQLVQLVKEARPFALIVEVEDREVVKETPVNEASDCRLTRRRRCRVARCLTGVTPVDSIAWAAGHFEHVHCIDDLCGRRRETPAGQQPFTFPDDALLQTLGIEGYLQRLAPVFATCNCPGDAQREEVMAARLSALPAEPTLVVIGAAHFAPIRRRLNEGAPTTWHGPLFVASNLRAIPLRASSAYQLGLCGDDAPAIVRHFEEALLFDLPFDCTASYRAVLSDAVKTGLEADVVGLRSLITLETFTQRWTAIRGRYQPRFADLMNLCKQAVGNSFANVVYKRFMEYPDDPETESTRCFPCDNGVVVEAQGECWFVEADASDRRPAPPPIFCVSEKGQWHGGELNEDQQRMVRQSYDRRIPPNERDLIQRMTAAVRDVVKTRQPEHDTREFTGDLGRGIDVRRTIRDRISGQRRLPRIRVAACAPPPLDPVVWIWDAEANVRHVPASWDYNRRGIRAVAPSYYYMKRSERLGSTGIIQSHIAYVTSFFRCEIPVWSRWAIIELLDSLEVDRLPTISPRSDPELTPFQGHHRAIAHGIRWAGEQVIIVSNRGVEIGNAVIDYARSRNIDLQKVYAEDIFTDQVWRRASLDHQVPCPAPFAPPFDFLLKLVPPTS